MTIKLSRLAHHLRTAAAAYNASADQQRQKGNQRLFLEFRRLEKECYDLADGLEEPGQSRIGGDDLVTAHNTQGGFPDTRPFEG